MNYTSTHIISIKKDTYLQGASQEVLTSGRGLASLGSLDASAALLLAAEEHLDLGVRDSGMGHNTRAHKAGRHKGTSADKRTERKGGDDALHLACLLVPAFHR